LGVDQFIRQHQKDYLLCCQQNPFELRVFRAHWLPFFVTPPHCKDPEEVERDFRSLWVLLLAGKSEE